jgi:hypothetical protein
MHSRLDRELALEEGLSALGLAKLFTLCSGGVDSRLVRTRRIS